MRILVGCEESGVVSAAFRRRGHEAISCDLQGTRGDSAWHITGDVFMAIKKRGPWDMGIFFPPCTHVASSGARWWPKKIEKQRLALEFMRDLIESDIHKIAMENPVGAFSTWWKKPDQIIQPFQFGHAEWKTTCLWLKNLPPLVPTNSVVPDKTTGGGKRPGRISSRLHRLSESAERARERAKTFQGIADAMAAQWG